jgi:hypothetical protein
VACIASNGTVVPNAIVSNGRIDGSAGTANVCHARSGGALSVPSLCSAGTTTAHSTGTLTQSASHRPRAKDGRIPGCTDKGLALSPAPPALAREWQVGRGKLLSGLVGVEGAMGLAGEVRRAVEYGGAAGKQEVVEPKVDDGGKGLAEGNECGAYPNDAAYDDVIPVVV